MKPFEQKYGCTVKISYAGTVEEMFSKVKAAPNEYNIVSVSPAKSRCTGRRASCSRWTRRSSPIIRRWPLSSASIRYNKNLGGGTTYHIPIVWGTQTITVNTDKIPAA